MKHARSDDRPQRLDCALRWLDIHRIARRQPEFNACIVWGWGADDVQQEVWCRVAARQHMGSAYDPARASVGKYLHVLTRSVLRNLLQKAKTLRAHIVTPNHWPVTAGMVDAEYRRRMGERVGRKPDLDSIGAPDGYNPLAENWARHA